MMLHGVKPEEHRHNETTRHQQPAVLLQNHCLQGACKEMPPTLQCHANQVMNGAHQADRIVNINDLFYLRAGDCG